ncbi:helix-turn-helix domain-containing protein [Pelagibius sp.]|uniref:helix-turn-helix domain-containing protein n=1 Tax=Pelagibius sp. TaxID=1931238 RepID=UPI003B5122BF
MVNSPGYLSALFLLALLFAAAPGRAVQADDAGIACPSAFAGEAGSAVAAANSLSQRPEDQMRSLMADSFLDPTGALEPRTIAAQAFEPGHCARIFRAPLPGQALWLRFTVVNDHDSERRWFVTFMEYIFDEVTLFEQQADSIVALARNGRTVPLPERADTAVKTGFPLDVGPKEEKTFLLRITGTFAPSITPAIMSPDLFSDWTTLSLVMTAVMLGYLATIALISIVLFRHVEARFYQYYALYMMCFFVFSFIYDGWLSNFMGVTLPVTVLSPFREFMAGLGVFANIQYCRVLLRIDTERPAIRRLFTVLSGIAMVTTALAVVDPWRLSMPLHLTFFASPLVLLAVSLKKVRDGLPQAKYVACSLLFLTAGLSIAVYFFIFPIEITQAAAAYDLIILRPLTWGYSLAIMGETTFMMIAISAMMNAVQAQRRDALAKAMALQHDVTAAEDRHAEALKTSKARIEALEASLMESPDRKLQSPAEQRFVQSATECVLERLSEQGFGARGLAAALGTSEKTLGRRLKAACGLAPAAFIRSVRLNFARDLILLRQHSTIAEIAHAAGFSSVGHFAKLYRQEFGQTPSESFRSAKTAD